MERSQVEAVTVVAQMSNTGNLLEKNLGRTGASSTCFRALTIDNFLVSCMCPSTGNAAATANPTSTTKATTRRVMMMMMMMMMMMIHLIQVKHVYSFDI